MSSIFNPKNTGGGILRTRRLQSVIASRKVMQMTFPPGSVAKFLLGLFCNKQKKSSPPWCPSMTSLFWHSHVTKNVIAYYSTNINTVVTKLGRSVECIDVYKFTSKKFIMAAIFWWRQHFLDFCRKLLTSADFCRYMKIFLLCCVKGLQYYDCVKFHDHSTSLRLYIAILNFADVSKIDIYAKNADINKILT